MKKQQFNIIRKVTYMLGLVFGTAITFGVIASLSILLHIWFKWIINYWL